MTAVVVFAVVLAGTLLVGRPLIDALRRFEFRQHAYEDAPKSHAAKSGTPTMGGVLFVLAMLAALAVTNGPTAIALVVLGIGCGVVGLVDDVMAIRLGRNRGLRARHKFLATALVAVTFLGFVVRDPTFAFGDTVLAFGPQQLHVPHLVWYGLCLLAILATTHAVNLTDGLDGLAAGTALPPLAVFGWLAWRAGDSGVVIVDCAVVAATIGFLVYNRHPARIFMGDTGALALGGVLAGNAVLTGTVLALPVIGGVFAAEALSVIIQVVYFKRTRKRIFRMSPLHHHFELGGMAETSVTKRFWVASAILSLVGAAIAR
ncbi:MAG: phospho-N-acetylmuramoyl-pentapeptide-transferase [Vulcanimicrobiaceae bacterium]